MKNIYRFFVQPQIGSQTKSIIGYELLLKEYTVNGWRIPESFSAIDPEIIADLLIKTTKALSTKSPRLSININRSQLMTTSISNAIVQSQKLLYPTKLIVELTEDDNSKRYSRAEIFSRLKIFWDNNIQISLDDVGSGINQFDDIQQLLPFASELKFALQNFHKRLIDPEMQTKVHFWRAMSNEYNLRLVLEGIENQDDDQLSDKMGIIFKQGYYFGRPRLLKLPNDNYTRSA
ncbi:EAL domain-containing protein [Companilactobacillus nantensis]|uniref:Diguanylate cyclase phosphodiesterase domain 2 containing protein n=1 Tax=Companilactobacillus nantensis DSM 16982 TaxID=1423774 RepID=A0A0R1WLI3_9LACO|nr:EAL domain-containing protein [Companilactobacillus nantensis]KRM15891.1 diguanylate cyclase phosphodiesterase domain 2 containing protein [Companilactobacillus nantensis DSM 16982]GEO65319.1 diguanylate cyclase [Companilactobacillus nantensis]